MALPILTSIEDAIAIVDYLKTKALGSSIAEARKVVKKEILDPRKVTAYQVWNIVQKEGDRLKLAPIGRDLSRAKPEERASVFQKIIHSVPPYQSAFEMVYHHNLSEVTNVDIAAFWHEHFKDELGTKIEATIKDMAVCFFRLAEGASLGQLIVGRKGQATRFTISFEPLSQFIAEGALSTETKSEASSSGYAPKIIQRELKIDSTEEPSSVTIVNPKIFISHGKNMAIVEQLKVMLDLNNLEYEVAVEEETSAIPVSEKVFNAMHNCNAAVITVTADETEKRANGEYGVNQNVLIEIGAAFVLYQKRVILVWDKNVEVPSNLQGLYRCEFTGTEFSWADGMKLMKAISNFKK